MNDGSISMTIDPECASQARRPEPLCRQLRRERSVMASATKPAAKHNGRSGRVALATAAVALGNAHRRLLTLLLRLLGPRRAYAIMAHLARRCYDSADALRDSGEARCRAFLSAGRTEAQIKDISRRAFVHRIWNLTDLMLAPRFLRAETCDRYGARVPEPYLRLLLEAQQHGQPVILVTTYCGPYDLLPVFLGLNGIRATALYRPHPNRRYDRYRQSVRARTGCQMLPHRGAAMGISEALATGRTVALLIDPTEARRGIPVSFLGVPSRVPRAVGLLAERHGAVVAVAAIRRPSESFQFQLVVSDYFGPSDWRQEGDVTEYVTRRYCAALEKLVLDVPEQYLWVRNPAALKDRLPVSDQGSGKVAQQACDSSPREWSANERSES